MGARLRFASDWDVGLPHGVLVRAKSEHLTSPEAPHTRRGIPRVLAPTGPQIAATVAPAPGLTRSSILRRTQPLPDPEKHTTLEYDASLPPRRAALRRAQARPVVYRVDLDLGRARHTDPAHMSALVALSELESRSWQAWLAFGVGVVLAAALLAWFFA